MERSLLFYLTSYEMYFCQVHESALVKFCFAKPLFISKYNRIHFWRIYHLFETREVKCKGISLMKHNMIEKCKTNKQGVLLFPFYEFQYLRPGIIWPMMLTWTLHLHQKDPHQHHFTVSQKVWHQGMNDKYI